MGWVIALALASNLADRPPITFVSSGRPIIVKFHDPFFYSDVDKSAIVEGKMPQGGDRLYVIDDQGAPLRFSPYRPGMRRLLIDTQRQLAVRDKNGESRIVRAFAKPGLYTLVFADNLGINYEDMVSLECRVRVR